MNPALPEVVGFDWSVPTTAAEHSCMLAIVESADDPLDPSVRSTNERRPWVFIPNSRQIGLRNLHVVTASSPQAAAEGMEGMNVPNPSRRLKHVELILSRGDLAKDARLAVLVPKNVKIVEHDLKRVQTKLTPQQKKIAERLKLDASTMWVVEKPTGRIPKLPVAPGKTLRIGLLYHSGSKPKPGTASRFTILARQGKTLLGGSTYVLRIPEE